MSFDNMLGDSEPHAGTSTRAGPVGRFLVDCTKDLFASQFDRHKEPGLFLHDPLAVGAVIDPSFVATESMPVDIETRGALTEGMTVADRRRIHPSLKKPLNADICLAVDAPKFLDFFLKRLLDPNPRYTGELKIED